MKQSFLISERMAEEKKGGYARRINAEKPEINLVNLILIRVKS